MYNLPHLKEIISNALGFLEQYVLGSLVLLLSIDRFGLHLVQVKTQLLDHCTRELGHLLYLHIV